MSSKVSAYRSAMSIGVGKGSAVDVDRRVGRPELDAGRPAAEADPVVLDQLAPHDHRDVDHGSIPIWSMPFRKSMASCWSCCVAAQVMRSSPCFSL